MRLPEGVLGVRCRDVILRSEFVYQLVVLVRYGPLALSVRLPLR